jgi:long-chain acyl-CoA synthetase
MFFGVVLGYGSPRTLSDSSMRGCKGDIREFRPSILVGVPAIWEMVKKGIVAKIDGGGPLLRGAFWSAFYAKQYVLPNCATKEAIYTFTGTDEGRFLMQNNLPGSAILDTLVFNKVKEATGGRLRICFTAAAPIAKETQEFISMSIAPVINAYGMTETCGMGAICHPLAWTVSATGAPEPCVEIKLVDFSDAGYFSTNVPRQQGEIWIRGPSVMQGYYHPDEEEEQEEDWKGEGGWFKTGDIGEWDEMGLLRVIDRKKNLVKTLNGEYIALEKVSHVTSVSPPTCLRPNNTLTSIARIDISLISPRIKHLCLCFDHRDPPSSYDRSGRGSTQETCQRPRGSRRQLGE